jgi:WD40 repeat protein
VQAHPDASGDVVTGTLSGNLLVWRARNCIKKVAGAHAGPVNSIHALAQRGMVSGGKDGTVVVWDTELRKGATFDIAALGSVDPAVRSVHWDSATHVVLIGTRGAEVFEMADTDGGDVNDRPLVAGHAGARGVLALDVAPQGAEFATGGADATLRLWDAESHRMLRMAVMDAPVVSLAYSPVGTRLAVGSGSGGGGSGSGGGGGGGGGGTLMVLNRGDLSVLHQATDAKKPFTCIAYSPDGSALACGSADGTIYVYSALNDSCVARLSGYCWW